jgi:hypothetical protein
MAFFLNEHRRSVLIDNLTRLSMPKVLAENHACIGDSNLIHLDKIISAVIWRIAERYQQLQEPGTLCNEIRASALTVHMAADTIIFTAYAAEILQRKLPSVSFPRSTKALEANIDEINLAVILVLDLGNAETLQ